MIIPPISQPITSHNQNYEDTCSHIRNKQLLVKASIEFVTNEIPAHFGATTEYNLKTKSNSRFIQLLIEMDSTGNPVNKDIRITMLTKNSVDVIKSNVVDKTKLYQTMFTHFTQKVNKQSE